MCMYGGQRTVCKVWFSPSTIRVPRIKFMLSDLTASVLTTEPPLLPCAFFLPEPPSECSRLALGTRMLYTQGFWGQGGGSGDARPGSQVLPLLPAGFRERQDSPQQQLQPLREVHPSQLPGERHRAGVSCSVCVLLKLRPETRAPCELSQCSAPGVHPICKCAVEGFRSVQ